MTEKEDKKTADDNSPDSIITNHVIYGMVAGAIPVPLVDFIAITGIQIDMLKQLADFYKRDFDKDQGKSIASSLIGTSFAKAGASVIKAIPGVGTMLGISAQVIFAGATTYALGKVFDKHFASDGTLSTFNTEKMKSLYEEFLEKGKEIVKDLNGGSEKDDLFATIEKLKKMKDSGIITEADFEKAKRSLLEKISS